MTTARSARFFLRAATASDHEAVDQAFTRFELGDRSHYGAFLLAQGEAFFPIEAGIDRFDLAPVLSDWKARRRSDALLADLADLGAKPGPVGDVPVFGDAPSVLGAIYVLEGSRLGGRMLERSVPADLPRRFLGAGDPVLWRKFIDVLDRSLVTEAQLAAATAAARAVFARFAASARRHGEDLCR